jgi:hypothetical protein
MKKTVFLFIFLVNFISVKADCSSSGISVWPKQQNIASNSIFAIQGYAQSQELIRQLNKKNKIYLKCNSEIILLKVLKILEGQYSLTQAILKPEKKLIIGKTYELKIDNLGMFDKDDLEITKWTVNSENDIEKPEWNCEPTYIGLGYERYGCGPAKFVNFCGKYNDNSPTLIYAKVLDKKTKISSDYFIQSENQKISLGHGMCSGAFAFDDDTNYEVQFGLMDASGNENLKLTEPIVFSNPTEKNVSEKDIKCNCTNNTKSNTNENNKTKLLIYSLLGIGLIAFGIIIYTKRKKASS